MLEGFVYDVCGKSPRSFVRTRWCLSQVAAACGQAAWKSLRASSHRTLLRATPDQCAASVKQRLSRAFDRELSRFWQVEPERANATNNATNELVRKSPPSNPSSNISTCIQGVSHRPRVSSSAPLLLIIKVLLDYIRACPIYSSSARTMTNMLDKPEQTVLSKILRSHQIVTKQERNRCHRCK